MNWTEEFKEQARNRLQRNLQTCETIVINLDDDHIHNVMQARAYQPESLLAHGEEFHPTNKDEQ